MHFKMGITGTFILCKFAHDGFFLSIYILKWVLPILLYYASLQMIENLLLKFKIDSTYLVIFRKI